MGNTEEIWLNLESPLACFRTAVKTIKN